MQNSLVSHRTLKIYSRFIKYQILIEIRILLSLLINSLVKLYYEPIHLYKNTVYKE